MSKKEFPYWILGPIFLSLGVLFAFVCAAKLQACQARYQEPVCTVKTRDFGTLTGCRVKRHYGGTDLLCGSRELNNVTNFEMECSK